MATIPTINFKAPDPVVEPTPSAFELATPPVAAEPVADVSDSSSWNFDTSFQIREPENPKPGTENLGPETENLEPGTENLEPGTGNLEPEGAAVLAALEDFLGAIRAARR